MQGRLFEDARPLVERLGREFFLQLPQCPGIYLMRGRMAQVLYVGKAKNLRKRVCSYRVANPERMARRTLRLLGLVENIEWEICPDEPSALRRESELLLSLKPRFNRAGVWQGPPRFLAWRCAGGLLELRIAEARPEGWEVLGPRGGKVNHLRTVLARLIWLAAQPERDVTEMPIGWANGRLESDTLIPLRDESQAVAACLSDFSQGSAEGLVTWMRARITPAHAFSRSVIKADLEYLEDHL